LPSANFATYLAATVKGAGWRAQATSFINSNSKSRITGLRAAKSTGIALTVKQVNGSIGYLDLSDADAMGVRYASLKNEYGQFLKPSVRSSSAFINVQKVNSSGLIKFDYTKKVKNGYNLSLVSYALVSLRQSDKSSSVKTFFTALVKTCGPANGPRLGFAALTGSVKTLSLKTIASIGTK
jgi:phosphate transport system substrate-binding protein